MAPSEERNMPVPHEQPGGKEERRQHQTPEQHRKPEQRRTPEQRHSSADLASSVKQISKKTTAHLDVLAADEEASTGLKQDTEDDFVSNIEHPSLYRVVGKLGYGSTSTVWLCRNLQTQEDYVALKVYINNSKTHRELSVCQHINSVSSQHPGREYVRKLLDSFEIEGPHGKHICLVFEPLGNSLGQLHLLADGALDTEIIRQAMRPILNALQFLHDEAGVIHTDLQPNKILLGIHDNAILAKFEQDELQEPSARKELPGRTIYTSRPVWPTARGWPSLSDFSEARFGGSEHTDLVMPDVYRAPEVILDMPWSYPIDVWGFAMVIWDLVEPDRLFTARDENGRYSEEHHLAQMVSVLGPPPQDFLQRSRKCEKYWDQNGEPGTTQQLGHAVALTYETTGNWIGDVAIPDQSLAFKERRLSGNEKAHFLAFMRKMLQWKPEDRSDWNDVFFSEWLVADLIESGHIGRDDD
ncbi:hypothetical protein PRZ48_012901 [Zasmidium cellare]|uniref:Protein kinase domain-containing protein n=1 Tax=Zasmidium cellare TaxID=395010 RepID=A0ABR0E2I1_ZASCE|nr:hypothetical protein PRZ48_012901 [Zasmidium cellare]